MSARSFRGFPEMDGVGVVVSVIKDVGFPIFVAVYLLLFVRKSLEAVRTSNKEIIAILKMIAEKD